MSESQSYFMFRSTHEILTRHALNQYDETFHDLRTWAYNFKSFHVVWTTQGLSCGDTKACKWVMKDSNVYAHLRSIQGPRSLLWSWHPDPENVETRVSSSCCDILTLILPRGWSNPSNIDRCNNSQLRLWLPKAQWRAQILPPRSDFKTDLQKILCSY